METGCVHITKTRLAHRRRFLAVEDTHHPNRHRLAVDRLARTETLRALGPRKDAQLSQRRHRHRVVRALGHIVEPRGLRARRRDRYHRHSHPGRHRGRHHTHDTNTPATSHSSSLP